MHEACSNLTCHKLLCCCATGTHQAYFNFSIDARSQLAIGIAKVQVGAEQRFLHCSCIPRSVQDIVTRMLHVAIEGNGAQWSRRHGQQYQLLARLLVELTNTVGPRIVGEKFLLQGLVRIKVLLALCKGDEVAFSCKFGKQRYQSQFATSISVYFTINKAVLARLTTLVLVILILFTPFWSCLYIFYQINIFARLSKLKLKLSINYI